MRTMAAVLLAATGLMAFTTVALSRECVRDPYGRVICGRPLGPSGYNPYYSPPCPPGEFRGRDDQCHPGGGYRRGYPRRGYAAPCPPGQQRGGDDQCHACPRGYTVQDGACRPYQGR